ncbi:hypothetical protein [Nocardioides dongxiaopingii]|uniref:hypothetical protein n=1 Tax=Nocardioides dongxiaopingii TaxID=2576036 RepID=UPI0010C76D93|nr:hypothetical protein [Nocardioides dongxiaopingii]
MTRRLLLLDRLAVLVVGLALVALGLLAADWQHGWVLHLDDRLDTGRLDDVLDAAWWPWTLAAAGVVLGLAGLAWLLAHLRRSGPSVLRLRASDGSGHVEADLASAATAAAQRLGTLAPVTGVRGTSRTVRSRTVLELRGHVDAAADVATLTEAAEVCAADVAAGFPDDDVVCRVVLDAPRRPRTGRSTRVRVR